MIIRNADFIILYGIVTTYFACCVNRSNIATLLFDGLNFVTLTSTINVCKITYTMRTINKSAIS